MNATNEVTIFFDGEIESVEVSVHCDDYSAGEVHCFEPGEGGAFKVSAGDALYAVTIRRLV